MAKPRAMARPWIPVISTGGYRSADFAASREASSWGAAATERVEVISYFVAGPKRSRSKLRMNSDHEPRGSLGSQNPYAEKMKWKPMIRRNAGVMKKARQSRGA